LLINFRADRAGGDCNTGRRHAWLLLGLLLSACASYSAAFHPIEKSLAAREPATALKLLEDQDHSDADLFLYFSNKAMILRMMGEYEQSNEQIEKAKSLIEKFTATSVTEEASSLVINDTTRTYIGTPVEQVMLHTYAALNYLEMGRVDEARVEALQVDLRLRMLMQDDPDSALSHDPFGRYLSGLIYEDLGEWSDAMIAYRKAFKGYQAHSGLYSITVPEQLKKVLILMADKVGLTDERREYEKSFGLSLESLKKERKGTGELIFLFHSGLAPIKIERSVQVLDPASRQLIRISLPYYERHENPIRRARITLAGAKSYTGSTELVEDIGTLEIKTLEANMPVITARAIVRAVAKYNMAKEAGKQNELAGLLVNIADFVTERADTRSWLSLPAEIQSARLNTASGEYAVTVELLDYNNNIVFRQELNNISIEGGRKQFLSFYWTSASANTEH